MGPLGIYYDFQFYCFSGIPEYVNQSLIFVPSLEFFLLLVFLVQLHCDNFYYVLLYFLLYILNEGLKT